MTGKNKKETDWHRQYFKKNDVELHIILLSCLIEELQCMFCC